MKAHYHFHIQNFVNVSHSTIGDSDKTDIHELLELIKQEKLPAKVEIEVNNIQEQLQKEKPSESLIQKSLGVLKKTLASRIGMAMGAELVIKLAGLMKMIKF